MNKNKLVTRTLLAGILLASLPIYLKAQNPSAKQWTLKECIERALDDNLAIQRSLLDVEASRITYKQSKLALLPSVSISSGSGFNWGRSIDPTSNEFITEEIFSTNAGANASVTLFNGFSLRNTIYQNKFALEAGKNNLKESKNKIILNVILLYIDVIFNQELLKNAESQLASSKEQLNRAEKQEKEGAIPKSSLYDLVAQSAS